MLLFKSKIKKDCIFCYIDNDSYKCGHLNATLNFDFGEIYNYVEHKKNENSVFYVFALLNVITDKNYKKYKK